MVHVFLIIKNNNMPAFLLLLASALHFMCIISKVKTLRAYGLPSRAHLTQLYTYRFATVSHPFFYVVHNAFR